MVRIRTAQSAALALCLSIGPFYGATASYLPRRANSPPAATLITSAPTITRRAAETFTAVTGCHAHGDDVFCQVGADEYQVIVPATVTGEVAPTYTGCHTHGSETYCLGPDDIEVEVLVEAAEDDHEEEEGHDDDDDDHEEEEVEESCHFHAGVEHCTGAESLSSSGEVQCARRDRDYDITLRIGLVFAMLATSFIGVALPIFLKPLLPGRFQIIFTVLKQFGTGVIVATALIHLFTHATLMFANECLGGLKYEAVTAAIVLAGLFIAFLVEHLSHRVARRRWSRSSHPDDVVSVSVLEAGIIFHSLLIGLTLVVAGDSVFITLFIVIVFHQAFEGIALGTRIATAGHLIKDGADSGPDSPAVGKPGPDESATKTATTTKDPATASLAEGGTWRPLSGLQKLAMAAAFAVVTPVGMAIGIGVLHSFNGNDPSTIVAIGTLDALSAGILLWVGVVEMWATDWMFGGELEDAEASKTALAGFGLVAGFVLMAVLGKWA
ncbi:hypothetical protein F4802DRAFT_393643 [Xylaria palmicola]|nr:hypothetical protein F4802DRAFT_393643 [Xylaria palmicola]